MINMSRRGAIAGLLGLATTGTLAQSYIANAEVRSVVVWVNQSVVPREDAAFKVVAEGYAKAGSNKSDYSIMLFMPQNQKKISTQTRRDVPDLVFVRSPSPILPQNAWGDKLVGVSDVVKLSESQFSESAKSSSTCYNKATKQHLKPYVEEGIISPTMPVYERFTLAWGQVDAEQIWGQAHADIIKNDMKVANAMDKAFKRAEQIFARVTYD